MILTGGRVYAPGRPQATALVVHEDRISYVGDDPGARDAARIGDREVRLDGALVTPAFVDAHLHAVQTGQVMAGLDLHGAASRDAVLDAVSDHLRHHRGLTTLVGQGWDERGWADPRPPTRAELDRAAPGVAVYLARVDVHSAAVSSALLDRVSGIGDQPGYDPDGWLTREAHHRSRATVNTLSTDAERRGYARAALRRAAACGVASVHELGGPHLGPPEDLVRVRDAAAELGLHAVGYWGEPADATSVAMARDLGLAGLAGDLCIDGAIGSRTAALHRPYADHPDRGVRYLDDEEIEAHVVRCTESGLQAGFHCIGDEAVAAAVTGFRRAAARLGEERVRAARHRLEHLEMPDPADLATLANLGVVASVQPAFDAAWGGPGELYEQRLGDRAQTMNPLGDLHRAGVALAFGTDAPVTPIAGWDMVGAAVRHHRPRQRLDVATAFGAATLGGHRAGKVEGAGTIRSGARAWLAVWAADGALDRCGLPALRPGDPEPRCVATLAGGRVVFGSDAFDPGRPGRVG